MFDISLYESFRGKSGGIISLDSVNSTNIYAVSGSFPAFTVITAEEQTEGRGRSGRKWHSLKGLNLYFSIVLNGIEPQKLLPMNIFAGYVMADTLRDVAEIKIKWPNDIIAGGKKLAGILMETSFSGGTLEKAVLGIGLNVNIDEFPEDIAHMATSLKLLTGRNFFREELLASFMNNLESGYDDFITNRIDLVKLWSDYSAFLDKKISIHKDGVKTQYTERGIDDFGCLKVENDQGRPETIVTGDIGYDFCR
ncbi:biotin--[acetyl-CoA-carboxylase] ligase [Seleniivibrio sp.]|uniref:biotin--[acetyl-CoA-carboxylase] ligase n=1 Tax=Seleniivibrio sp. TaxID=2898801 RepID=UPI0025E3A709|nr:biotin--[acetyl-CoA-carboxylase] ligase [Seleniivibrio sp.]MCD8553061.1 biotin--[acetyl-CoA-carboxylase] ligase [Seleniivibrio sp.]